MADLKVKVGGIHAEIAADGAELLAALQFLADFDKHFIKVAVEGVYVADITSEGISVGVADDGYVAPALADVMSEGHDTTCARVYGIAKVCIATTAAVPVFTKVSRRAQAEAAGFVVTTGIGFTDGEVKAVCEFDSFLFFPLRRKEGRGRLRGK